MALGNVTNEVQTGGRTTGATAADLARTVVCLNVSPGGTPNTVYAFASETAVKATLDTGPLAEQVAKLLEHGAGTVYAVPLTPSSATSLSAVTQTGTGAGAVTVATAPHKTITILCTTSGAIATAKFKFSLDGGSTYSAEYASADSGGGSYVVRCPGTFTTLTFAAANYVATKTCTVAVTGTVTTGSGWVGVVTQASSPVDNYDVRLTMVKAGTRGTCVVRPSLDGGISTLPDTPVPSGGTVVLPGTGIVCTFDAAAFVAGDYYSLLACPPGYSSSDVEAAMDALRASSSAPQVALVHVGGLPSSAAGAVSAHAVLAATITTARSTNGKFYMGLDECPTVGDTFSDSGTAAADTADTDSTVRAAAVGATDTSYASMCVGTNRMQSSLSSAKLKRPTGWALAARYVEADPNADVSEVGRGPLDVYAIGRDEATASTSLHDAKVNVLRTYPGRNGAYLAIESGGVGWRNLSTDADFQDAGAVRVLLLVLNAITIAGQKYLGSRQKTNPDGTIAEVAAGAIDADLDGVIKRTVGLLAGGAFVEPQAASASASVDRASQLGQSPKRLDVSYSLQPLGLVSAVRNRVLFSGVLPVTE